MDLKALAINWWTDGSVSFQEKCELSIKYFGAVRIFDSDGVYSLTDDEITTIFMKEKLKN